MAEENKSLHFKKIFQAGQILQNTALPISERVEAARALGILGYSGGYTSAKHAAEFMPIMVELLKTPNARIVQVLEGLSGICHAHVGNQNLAKTLEIPELLQENLGPNNQASTKVKLWSCYLLYNLCYNNKHLIQALRSSETLETNLEELQGVDWYGWHENYAESLLHLLFLLPPQAVANGTDQSAAPEMDT